jgi:hypothetical protein
MTGGGVVGQSGNVYDQTVKDSTSNGNTGNDSVNTSTRTTAGQIDGALLFQNANGNSVSLGTGASLHVSSAFTFQGWVKLTSPPIGAYGLLTCTNPIGYNYAFLINNAGAFQYRENNSSSGAGNSIGGAVQLDTWTSVTVTFDGTNIKFYQNGTLSSTAASVLGDSTSGVCFMGGTSTNSNGYFDGVLDEIRLSNSARSADWIATEYNNQSAPNSFYTLGSELTGGGAPPTITGISPSSGAAGTLVTISGSGFGSAQGTGVVWLGTNHATIVTWDDGQVVATVASGSTSGMAQVRQNGLWSNAVPFTVTTAVITNVTPASGLPGTQVTITGSGFGAPQGNGQVWLGTASGVIQTWNDNQVVALVAAGSATGKAQVLQNGVWSNAVAFSVNTPTLTSISPTSGPSGTVATFNGSGFGSTQGSGVVWLGSMAGGVQTWRDNQVTASVATGAVTGIARIQQNGVWTKAFAFTVTGGSGRSVALVPNLLNMVVGDTHTIEALGSNGQPLTGLTWTASDSTIVSLSSADPPLLTALAAGHVTITAGGASSDITVSAGALPLGTVLWSNPGNGCVSSIVPAVPSPNGVADVFAFPCDNTRVQAITSDGTTAWTADVSQAQWVMPDFQGGLVELIPAGTQYSHGAIVKLDGITGQVTVVYTPTGTSYLKTSSTTGPYLSLHTDGTVFAVLYHFPNTLPDEVIGIDPTTGTQKFSVPLTRDTHDVEQEEYELIVAGDGYAYGPTRTEMVRIPTSTAT